MSNFPLVWAFGAPFKGILPAANMTEIDGRFPKISNWKEGSDHTLDASAVVALRGTSANSNNLLLDVPVVLPQDQALSLTGASGHPAKINVGNFCTIDVLSGGTLKVESGGTLSVLAGAASTNASVLGVQFTGTQPAKNADPGADNIAIGTNMIKAWGHLSSDGAGNVSCNDGMNISSVVLAGSNRGWTVTLVRAMASTNYVVAVTYQIVASGNLTNSFAPKSHVTGVSAFDILIQKTIDESYIDASASVYGVGFIVIGRQ